MAETPTAQTASLEGIEGELLGAIAKAADLGALEEVRVAALGKKGRVSELMQTLGRMAPEDAQELRPGGQSAQRARRRGAGSQARGAWPCCAERAARG